MDLSKFRNLVAYITGSMIVCALLFTSTTTAGDKELKKDNKFYVKVIDNVNTTGNFTCDTYPVTIQNTLSGETYVEQVAHPILSAVAYCPEPEEVMHSVTQIYSWSSDLYEDDKLNIFWYAKAHCSHYDTDEFTAYANKVVLLCWDKESDTDFPGIHIGPY